MESRESLINQIALLHEEKEHQKIIALIEGQPPAAMDYELTSLLARAYINYAQPYMDSFQEHIKHAVELLRTTDDKTYLVAEKVGYDEPNYFSYVFKKRFGISPSQFRK